MVDYTVALKLDNLTGPEWKKFIADVRQANDRVASLGKSPEMDKFVASTKSVATAVERVQTRIEGLIGAAKGIGALWAGNEALQWAKRTAVSADETLALGHAMGFTADQIQAMQIAAAKNGTTLEEQAAFYGKNRALLDEMTESMRRQGMIMSGPTRQGFADVNQEMEKVGRTWDALRASFGDTGMIGQGMSVMSGMIHDIGASLAYVETYRGTVGLIREVGAILTGGGGLIGVPAAQRAAQFLGGLKKDALEAEAAVQKLEVQLRNLPPEPANAPRGGRREGAMIRSERGEVTAQLGAARKVRDEANAAVERAEAAIAKAESITNTARSAPYISTGKTADQLMGLELPIATTGGGGGGRTDDDMLEAQIKRYDALGVAATSALRTINLERGKSLEDMQREVNVKRQIDEIAGKLGAKYTEASQAQKDRMRASVSASELERSNVEKLMQAHARADATERQYGDGQLVLRDGVKQLNEALDTGRITSVGAYDNAIKVLAMSTEDLRLKNLGLAGGLPAFGAGWQNAQNQFERANNAYAMGGQTFNLVTSTMDQGLTQFVKNGKIELADFVGNFFLSIAQMEMRAAASSLFGAAGGASGILGAIGGAVGSLFGGGFVTGGVGGVGEGMLSGIGGTYAEGGAPPVGITSVVGERGPELFLPKTAGNILNREQLQALGVGGGGGGGVSVVVYQTNHFGSDVSRNEFETRLVQLADSTRKASIAGTLDAISRGGNARMTVRA